MSSGGLASAAGLIGAFNSFADASKATRVANQSIAVAQLEIDKQLSDVTARAETISVVLSEKYGWKKGEAGFAGREQDANEVKDLVARKDTEGLRAWIAASARKRPRDPIVALTVCRVESADAGADAARLLAAAQECARAARLVPAAELYDADRGRVLYAAARMATGSALTAQHAGDTGRATASGEYATAVFEAAAGVLPPTASGDARGVQQSWAMALAAAGHPKEALTKMAALADELKDDPGYTYNLACLCSLVDQPDLSIKWLERSMSLGYSNIRHALSDSDFAKVRAARPQDFARLTTINYSWSVEPVVLSKDAITLTNNSPFTLTNVVLKARIQAGGSVIEVPPLAAESLAPGKTVRWAGVVLLPGNRYDGATAEFACDQVVTSSQGK